MIEKKYLTFEELRSRWQCDKNHIHYLISAKELVPSYAWDGYAYRYFWEPISENDNTLQLVPETGSDDFLIREYLRGWIYLQRPHITGPHKYWFSFATYEKSPVIEEYADSWFKLLVTSPGHEVSACIDERSIEANAVFMTEQIADYENSNPKLDLATEIDLDSETVVDLDEENQEGNSFLGRRELQNEVIVAVIAALGFDPKRIPDGGKAKIKSACLTSRRLFTSDGFDHAWKEGVKDGLFRMANHNKYAARRIPK